MKNGIWLLDIMILLLTVAYKYIMVHTQSEQTILYIGILMVLILLFTLKLISIQLFLKRTNTFKDFQSNIIFLGIIVLFLTYMSKDPNFLIPFMLATTFFIQDSKYFVKCFFSASLLIFTLQLTFYFCGFIQDTNIMVRYVDDGMVIRHYLGFEHANSAFLFFLPIVYGFYYINGKRNLLFWLIIFVSTIVIYKMTYSRTGFYLIVVSFFLMFFDEKVYKKKSILKLVQHSFIIFTVVSIIMAFAFGETTNSINELLSDRPWIWKQYLDSGLSLFGQSDMPYPLDNFYLFILYNQGILVFLLLAILFNNAFKQAIKNENIKLVIIMMCYLIYGISETNTILFSVNFTLVFLFVGYFNPNYFLYNPKEKMAKVYN